MTSSNQESTRVYEAPAKVNIFLRITGTRDQYHELISRFVRVESLSDFLWFEPGNRLSFEIEGVDCPRSDNTIFKAYKALLEHYPRKEIVEFGKLNRVVVKKRIPTGAGLGGGSSDAATFLLMLNDAMELGIPREELAAIGAEAGSDIPFFIMGYKSANVRGIGEIVEPFDETPRALELLTPNIHCNTGDIYRAFRMHFKSRIDPKLAETLAALPSDEILARYNAMTLNDLLPAALKRHPELYAYAKPGWFFSGSGSSFFRPAI